MAPKPTRLIDKLDLRTQYRELYAPWAKQVLDVPDLRYTKIE